MPYLCMQKCQWAGQLWYPRDRYLGDEVPPSHFVPYRETESGIVLGAWPTEVLESDQHQALLTPLQDLLPDDAFENARRVWIVGGGPSLRRFNFDLLRGEVVIGVNRAFEIPAVGLTVSMDERFHTWVTTGTLGDDARELWGSYDGVKAFVMPDDREYKLGESVYAVLRSSTVDHFPPSLGNRFGRGVNSGYMALLIAWALGAKRIGLLGFDMSGESGKQAWRHAAYPHIQDVAVYKGFIDDFERAAPHLRADGVEVVNYGEDSALECFEKKPLKNAKIALRRAPERPLVVGYYTEGTGYEDEIKGMVQSARAHGFEVAVKAIPNRGNWQANTYAKADIIFQALNEYNRPILYLDADARIRRYPALFDGFKGDLGLSWFNWDEMGVPGRSGREFSTAVMYLKPTPEVKCLIDAWRTFNELRLADNSPRNDQRNLADLMHDRPDVVPKGIVELPHTYNQIFDTMAHVGAPVIEQMQASRRLKEEVAA